ncbi:hypothetical protein Tco_0941214, partial [Tanacetum coccineum]
TKSKAARYELKGIEDMVPNLWSPVKHNVYLTKRILSVISVKVNKWYGYGHLEEIVVKRADQQLPAYTTLSIPKGVIYEDNLKRKRFMRADEFHKFCNDTLISVRDTLDQMLHELHVGYNTAMRKRLWTSLDHQRTCIIIKVIN